MRLICGWGFARSALERIELMAATGNPASQRVAERAGFTREAVLRSYMRGGDERQDMVAFGLLARVRDRRGWAPLRASEPPATPSEASAPAVARS